MEDQQKGPTGAGGEISEALEFIRRLWALDHSLQTASKRMHRNLGITGQQRLVVRFIGRYPGINAGHLAEVLQLHPSTLSGVFQRLERQKLIVRVSDPKDGRRTGFDLTAAGRKVDRSRAGTSEGIVQRTLLTLPPEKVEAAREVLSTLRDALQGMAVGKRKPRVTERASIERPPLEWKSLEVRRSLRRSLERQDVEPPVPGGAPRPPK